VTSGGRNTVEIRRSEYRETLLVGVRFASYLLFGIDFDSVAIQQQTGKDDRCMLSLSTCLCMALQQD
jgi:hypothetical protein